MRGCFNPVCVRAPEPLLRSSPPARAHRKTLDIMSSTSRAGTRRCSYRPPASPAHRHGERGAAAPRRRPHHGRGARCGVTRIDHLVTTTGTAIAWAASPASRHAHADPALHRSAPRTSSRGPASTSSVRTCTQLYEGDAYRVPGPVTGSQSPAWPRRPWSVRQASATTAASAPANQIRIARRSSQPATARRTRNRWRTCPLGQVSGAAPRATCRRRKNSELMCPNSHASTRSTCCSACTTGRTRRTPGAGPRHSTATSRDHDSNAQAASGRSS